MIKTLKILRKNKKMKKELKEVILLRVKVAHFSHFIRAIISLFISALYL